MKRFSLMLGLILCAVAPAAAQVPPNERWSTIETANFRVTFGPGLEELARHAARRAEVAYARLAAELTSPPDGKVDILLTDAVDVSNGFAMPFPGNRIVLYARPPVDVMGLAYFDDWMDLVVTHELVHTFHLDATGRVGRGLRNLFGRLPLPWPVFPVINTPTWSMEGLATYIESRFTGAGRVNGSYHEMVLRTAVLEGAFESIDQVSGTSPTWPGAARSYIYGSLFLDHLSKVHGPEVQKEFVRATAGSWLPPPLAFDRVAKTATGQSFSDAFAAWRLNLENRYRRLADSLAVEGLTATERVGAGGQYAMHPRVAPDGRVAYAAANGRTTPAVRLIDPGTGATEDLARLDDIGPLAWLPDGSVLVSRLEYDGPYRAYADLYRVDAKGSRRLTRGARLTDPDVTRDGRRVVAVEAEAGTNRLVIHDLEHGGVRPVTDADPEVHWAFPRWAPDGNRIAASRWRGGRYDVVVLDTLGTVLVEVASDRAIEMAPTWSPDGRYVVFSSDRSGIPNLYAFDLEADTPMEVGEPAPALRQVTHLLTGAFFPDVSPDGRWIYFSGYHADGFHIERIPFDPSSWRDPAPLLPTLAVGDDDASAMKASVPPENGTGEVGAARPYSPFPTLLPRYWVPYLPGDKAVRTFIGIATSGTDLVGRHAYEVGAAYQPSERLAGGFLSYRYAGLGNPVLGIDLERNWEGQILGVNIAEGTRPRLLLREDEIRLSATMRRQRRRSAATLMVGAEGVARAWSMREVEGPGPRDPEDRLVGGVAQVTYANARVQPFSISPEDGTIVSLLGRKRWDLDPFRAEDGSVSDRGYDEGIGQVLAFKAFDLPGFARHVLAARFSTRVRHGPGALPIDIGGVSGESSDILTDGLGGSRRLLPVRGFREGDRYGTTAWTASVEYRFPLTSLNRGHRLWPVFLDRLSGALFVDAGDAWCETAEGIIHSGCAGRDAAPLVSAGGELGLDLTLFFRMPVRLRGGIAVPIEGPRTAANLYLGLGHSF